MYFWDQTPTHQVISSGFILGLKIDVKEQKYELI